MRALSLFAALQKAGWQVTLWAPDPHDQARGRDMLAQAGLNAKVLLGPLPKADLIIEAGAMPDDFGGAPLVLTSPDARLETGAIGICRSLSGETLEVRLTEADLQPKAEVLGRAIGGHLVFSGGPGYVMHLLREAMLSASDALLFDGASPAEIDAAMVAEGWRLGPYEWDDLAGVSPSPKGLVRDRAIAEGRLGKAHGWGWYRYPGGGGKVEDPLIEDLIAEEAHFAGKPQRLVTEAEIRTALTDAVARVGKQALHEGWVDQSGLTQIETDLFSPRHPRL